MIENLALERKVGWALHPKRAEGGAEPPIFISKHTGGHYDGYSVPADILRVWYTLVLSCKELQIISDNGTF